MTRRRDLRTPGIALTLAAVLALGAWIAQLGPAHPPAPLYAPAAPRDVQAPASREAEVRRSFNAAVLLLHSRDYARAAAALKRVLKLAPRLPEAHVNLGFALLGLQRPAPAREAFEAALSLKAEQANAYYGLSLAHEAQGDLELALGAMRTYLHLGRDEDPAHLRRARSALWEWEAKLAEHRNATGR